VWFGWWFVGCFGVVWLGLCLRLVLGDCVCFCVCFVGGSGVPKTLGL